MGEEERVRSGANFLAHSDWRCAKPLLKDSFAEELEWAV